MLGALLGVGQELLGDARVLGGVGAARPGAPDRPRRHVPPAHGQQRLGRRARDLEVQEVQEVHVGARVDHAQAPVDRENGRRRPRRSSAARAPPGTRRPRATYSTMRDTITRLEPGALHVRRERRARAGRGRLAHRTGAREQAPRLGDRPVGVLVGRVEIAVVGVDVDQHRDREVAQVVEDHQHVGEHQRHVGQADRSGVGLAERLHRAHEVVAEVAHRAAGERRHLGERRLAERAHLGGGQRVGVAPVAQRPAHHLARAHADEAEAPTRWPCSALSSRNAGNSGSRPRSFRNALTGVSRSSMKVWRRATRLCSRASTRTSSSDGSTAKVRSAAAGTQHLLGPRQVVPRERSSTSRW